MKLAAFKRLCTDGGQYGLNVAASDYRDEGVPLLRTTDISSGNLESDPPKVDRPTDTRFLLREGDLLVSRSGSVGEAHMVTAEQESSTFAGYLIRFRPNIDLADGRFTYYLAKSDYFARAIASDAIVSTIANFNADRYANIPVPIVAVSEQRRIADFLDDQVGRVDNIIAARERQRALVRDLERADLVETIFGVSQRTIPLGYIAQIDHGRQRSPENERGPYMTQYVRSANVSDGSIDTTDLKLMNFNPRERETYGLRPGDVLVTEGSGSVDAIGASAQWTENPTDPVCFQNHLLRLRPRAGLAVEDFLHWWARASYRSGAMRIWATGANILNLGSDALKRMPVPQLSLDRQRRVAARAETVTSDHQKVMASLEHQADRLTELKQSLITAAVSGEFDVSSADGSGVTV